LVDDEVAAALLGSAAKVLQPTSASILSQPSSVVRHLNPKLPVRGLDRD
jgi:hypothetical protein